MRSRRFAVLVIAILFMFSVSLLAEESSLGSITGSSSSVHLLAPGNGANYSEDLTLYLTSGETFWRSNFTGGNITISSISVPSTVSGFSITLTHYATWKSQFELFTMHGYGLLGNNEPSPNGAFLQINATSQSDAQSLANSLSQRFALVFQPVSQSSGTYTFFSPMDFSTEIHAFFWSLVPVSYGGFAQIFTQQQVESADLSYYEISYSSSIYSLSIGALTPLVSTQFTLFNQLGLSGTGYNYSSAASNSTIQVHVLGGLITNASTSYSNYYSNFSASMSTKNSGNQTIPNLRATLDFSFPTILAYREVSPNLTPATNSTVTVTIFVKDVSPAGSPAATDVSVNDSWILSQTSNFRLTVSQISGKWNMTSGQTETLAYAFTVLASSGSFNMPATPVTYQYLGGANKTISSTVLLNPETLIVGGQNTPALEATATLNSASIQAGQTYSVNITVANKGSGTAFNVRASGLAKQDLPQGSTWTFNTNTSSASLTQANATVSYPVSWTDSSGTNRSTSTNTLSAFFGFASPGTPGMEIEKTINVANDSRSANVTLTVLNTSPNSLSNLTVRDFLPAGVVFAKSYNTTSLRSIGSNEVVANVTSLKNLSNLTLSYNVDLAGTGNNYVFSPATVTALWNNINITHSSQGIGLPLGVVATKTLTPSQAFQGSNASLSLGLVNNGSLPIYLVSLNNTYDPVVSVSGNASSYEPVLSSGGTMSKTVNAAFSGVPGTYNTSNVVANFVFVGFNQTVSSKLFAVTIYQLVRANMTSSATKYEEGHDINIAVTVANPSNVTVDNVKVSVNMPQGLTLKSGQTGFSFPSLGPGQSTSQNFTVITNQPNVYFLNVTSITFQYQGHTLKGAAGNLVLNLGDDLTLRYGIPIAIALVLVLATLFYVRRLQKGR